MSHKNKKMKKILSVFLVLISLIDTYGQSAEDALKFSNDYYLGSARTLGMSNAFSALGGNFGSASSNPAGLAAYTEDNLGMSIGLNFANNKATYLGNENTGKKSSINISNAYVVLNKKYAQKKQDKGWLHGSFGFGYNRVNNYAEKTFYEGFNEYNSLTDWFAEQANGYTEQEISNDTTSPRLYDSYLAYHTYLIDPDTANNVGNWNSILNDGGIAQSEEINSFGGKGDANIAYSANYKNKLLIGASLNIPIIYQTTDSDFSEDDSQQNIGKFESFEYGEHVKTNGRGIQLKLGVTVLPIENLRLGLAFHTPQKINLTDSYYSTIYSKSWGPNGIGNFEAYSPKGIFGYKLYTPLKAIFGAGYLIKKKAYITMDYEYTDFSQIRYEFDSYIEEQENRNEQIQQAYTTKHTIRVGTEVKLNDMYFLRAGGNYSSDFMNSKEVNAAVLGFSGGLGIVINEISLDFAYNHRRTENGFNPYTLSSETVQSVDVQKSTGMAVFSFSFLF